MEGEFNFAKAFKDQEFKDKEEKKEKKRVSAEEILSKIKEENQKSFNFAKEEEKKAEKAKEEKEKEISKKTSDPDKDKTEVVEHKKHSFFHRHHKHKEVHKKEPKPEHTQKKPRQNILRKEFTVTPIHGVKLFLFLLVVCSIFLAGRVSTDGLTALGVYAPAEIVEEDNTQEELIERLLADAAARAAAESVVEEPEPVIEEPEPVVEVVREETVITSYSSIGISLNNVQTDWKGTWGKIIQIDYTIINNEIGTIKPDHFILRVQGYDDLAKDVPLPLSGKTIKSNNRYAGKIQVPQGFAYNPITVGDLLSVPVSITLVDSEGREMGGDTRSFNLNG